MDVTFETPQGRRFTIQIWYLSTVKRIKEYIQQYEGIPIETQKLFFMGKELQDDRDTEFYSIAQGSHVLLVLHDGSPTAAQTHDSHVHVVVYAPSVGRSITLNLKASDTIARLKELLQERTDGMLQANHMNVFFDEVEMDDGKALGDYGPSRDVMEICVIVTKLAQHISTWVKDNMMTVKVKQGSQMVILEVSNLDVVEELRAKLGRVAPHFLRAVDGGGCSFIYKQNVMEEDCTLHWHEVKDGDTIEIFNSVVPREA